MLDSLKLHGLIGGSGGGVIVRGLEEQVERDFLAAEEIQAGDFIAFNDEGKAIKARTSFKLPQEPLRVNGSFNSYPQYGPRPYERIYFLENEFGIRFGVFETDTKSLWFNIYEIRNGKYFLLNRISIGVAGRYIESLVSFRSTEAHTLLGIILTKDPSNVAYFWGFSFKLTHKKNYVGCAQNQVISTAVTPLSSYYGAYYMPTSSNSRAFWLTCYSTGNYHGQEVYHINGNTIIDQSGRDYSLYASAIGGYVDTAPVKDGYIMFRILNSSYDYAQLVKVRSDNSLGLLVSDFRAITPFTGFRSMIYPFIIPVDKDTSSDFVFAAIGCSKNQAENRLMLYSFKDENGTTSLRKYKHFDPHELGYAGAIVWAGMLEENTFGVIYSTGTYCSLIVLDLDLNLIEERKLEIRDTKGFTYDYKIKTFAYVEYDEKLGEVIRFFKYKDYSPKGVSKNSTLIGETVNVVLKGNSGKNIAGKENQLYYVDKELNPTDIFYGDAIGYTNKDGDLIRDKGFWEV